MADTRITQKQAASLTYIDNWAPRLAAAYPGQTVTITSATATVAPSGAVVSGVLGTGTTITFHLATSAVTPAQDVTVTLNATLSNGDLDPRPLIVGVT